MIFVLWHVSPLIFKTFACRTVCNIPGDPFKYIDTIVISKTVNVFERFLHHFKVLYKKH